VEPRTGTRNPSSEPAVLFTYVDVAAVDNETKSITGARQIMGAEAPSRARKLIRAGDVLVSTVRPNLNAVALVPAELDGEVASTGFCVLRPGAQVTSEYLYFHARSRRFVDSLSQLVAGALYPAVTDAQVLGQRLPVPDLAEQRRIVDLLTRAEGIVRLRREAQQKAAELIPAIFVEMFGDPAFNPKSWAVSALGELLRDGPTNGLYKHKSAYGTGTPILRIDAIYDGVVSNMQSLKRLRLDSDQEYRRFALTPGDIVINRVNSPEYLGKSALIPPLAEPTVFESNMMRFALDTSRVLPGFVIALLQHPTSRKHLLSHAKHAINQSSINQQDVKSLPIIVPPLALQARFDAQVQVVSSICTQQAVAQTKAQAAFDALLTQAFAP
jgi:type I restriction enzyme, S subunit